MRFQRAGVWVLAGVVALAAAAGSVSQARADVPADPLKSPMWRDMVERYFGDQPVRFDDRVRVTLPSIVENQAQVPVTADARAVPDVVRMIVFADLNPIQHVLTFTPAKAEAYISFRMKVEQGTPVRAAVETRDGVWHVGGVFLDAAGGGCSAPAEARKEISWADTLGETQGRLWRDPSGHVRARLRIRHPMDTGLAKDNTPAYYIEKTVLRAPSGEVLATLEMFEPMSEDPTMTLLLGLPSSAAALEIDGRDNNGREYKARVPAPWHQSSLPAPASKSAAHDRC